MASAHEAFDSLYTALANSPLLWNIFRDALGSAHGEDLQAYGLTTQSTLTIVNDAIGLGVEDYILDIGCGRGGPTMWLVAETGASAMGIDISAVAVAQARQRARDRGLDHLARFEACDAMELPFAADSFDAAVSFDALMFVPDRGRALVELWRVLKPGGRVAFTFMDHELAVPGTELRVHQGRALLDGAGFEIVSYAPTPEWQQRMSEYCRGVLASREELERALGAAAGDIIEEAEYFIARPEGQQHCCIVACKPAA